MTETDGAVLGEEGMTRILVVEDDAIVARDIQQTLEIMGYTVPGVAHSGAEAVREAERLKPDLALLDVRMPGELDGIEAGARISEGLQIPIVYLTAYADEVTLERAKQVGPLGYVVKPFDDRVLRSAIELALFRHRTERERREREGWIAALLRGIGDAVVATDVSGRVTYMNPVAERLTGWTAGEAAGRPVQEVVRLRQESGDVAAPDPFRQALGRDGTVSLPGPALLQSRDGRLIPVGDSAAPIHSLDGEVLGSVIVFRDVSSARAHRRELERSEARYRRLFDDDVGGNFVVSSAGIIEACNAAFARMFGFGSPQEAVGHSLERLLPPGDRPRDLLVALERGGRIEPREMEMRRRDGTPVHVVGSATTTIGADGETLEILGHAFDITERRRLQQQLQHSQKMEAVGRLAGGVAHDFNNLLTSITGYTDLALGDPSLREETRADLREVRRAADRATNLVRQLLALSRRQVLEPVTLDLNDVVTEMARMLARLLGERVRLETDLEYGPVRVEADPTRIEQVVLNLAVNARDAMPEGGRVTIRTRRVEVSPEEQARLQLADRRCIQLEVRDTGPGLDPGTEEHVFEPFFTTKEDGTGLGLSTVYGIVHQSGGHVSVESRPGRGATFRVLLPRAPEPAASGRDAGSASGLRRTALLVEPDERVRELARRVLARDGARVLAAPTVERGLQLWSRHRDALDLVILSVGPEETDEVDLLRRVRAEATDLPLLVFSAGGTSPAAAAAVADGARLLTKPFAPADLAAAVRELTGGRRRREDPGEDGVE